MYTLQACRQNSVNITVRHDIEIEIHTYTDNTHTHANICIIYTPKKQKTKELRVIFNGRVASEG